MGGWALQQGKPYALPLLFFKPSIQIGFLESLSSVTSVRNVVSKVPVSSPALGGARKMLY